MTRQQIFFTSFLDSRSKLGCQYWDEGIRLWGGGRYGQQTISLSHLFKHYRPKHVRACFYWEAVRAIWSKTLPSRFSFSMHDQPHTGPPTFTFFPPRSSINKRMTITTFDSCKKKRKPWKLAAKLRCTVQYLPQSAMFNRDLLTHGLSHLSLAPSPPSFSLYRQVPLMLTSPVWQAAEERTVNFESQHLGTR